MLGAALRLQRIAKNTGRKGNKIGDVSSHKCILPSILVEFVKRFIEAECRNSVMINPTTGIDTYCDMVSDCSDFIEIS
ncbi:hypothetical protein TUM4637_04450 [Shewanella hafniensis]|nr:hypothetical protein TUM4637_04450 [Shewanella hafniensis]